MTEAGQETPTPARHDAPPPGAPGAQRPELSAEHQALVAQAFAALANDLAYLDEADRKRVHAAFEFAKHAHQGQYRNSGEPYITHPIAVARLCASWHLDAPALMAALMHDAMEDCGVGKEDIVQMFGADVAELVDGVTKLDKIENQTREENQALSFRKMLLAMAKDVRVILIKLADRTHNMRTLSVAPRSKWARISRETQDIYAPIADRLGLHATYQELMELSFQHLFPWRYQTLRKAVDRVQTRRRVVAEKIRAELEQAFAQQKIGVRLIERDPGLYKVYAQMDGKSLSFAKVSDIFVFQAVFEQVMDCYCGLGVLHQTYRPLPGSFKDYIANPKPNGYQSLHTAVQGPSRVEVEVGLRTEAMHTVAELGIAAHWLYQSRGLDSPVAGSLRDSWLKSMLEIENASDSATDFLSDVKEDLHPDSIYVFTPKNRMLALPAGATVVDFAYAIHSDLGDHTTGANVNGQPVSLRTVLKNADTVEIISSETATPHSGWLEFVKTGRARARIRAYLRTADQQQAQGLGQRLLNQALRAAGYAELPQDAQLSEALWQKLGALHQGKSREQLLLDIGHGRLIAGEVVSHIGKLLLDLGLKPDALLVSRERLMDDAAHVVLTVGGADSAPARFSTCCHPVPGDAIVGLFISGRGLEVHRSACAVGKRRSERDASSVLAVEWAEEPHGEYVVQLRLHLRNTPGALAEAAQAIAQSRANILRIEMVEEGSLQTVDIRANVSVRDSRQLDALLRNLKHTRAVLRAERDATQ